MSKDLTTIGALCELEPGDKQNPQWVNDEFEARVKFSASKTTQSGTAYCYGTLVDPDTGSELPFTWFGRKVFPPKDTIVRIGGNGIQITSYNNASQLQFAKGTTVNVIDDAPPQHNRNSDRPPPARQAAGRQQHAAPAGQFLGVTVGMAVNNACQLALEEWKADESATAGDATYWRRVWDLASQILRIAAVLEKGKLAPATKPEADPDPTQEPTTGEQISDEEAAEIEAEQERQRAEAQNRKSPPASAKKPEPGPGGSVKHDDAIDPEDVPF